VHFTVRPFPVIRAVVRDKFRCMGFSRFVVGLLGVSAFACSSDDVGPAKAIDCSWFASHNCWNEVVDAAYACSNGVAGTFDTARSQCVGSDAKVTFAQSVPPNLDDAENFHWNVTVSRGATQCVHIADTEGGLEVESSAGLFRETLQGSTVTLQCPDGSRYSIEVSAALACTPGLPGYSYVDTSPGSSVSFDLSGSTPDSESLFACSAP
jgi:hypothetical protein